MYHRNKVHTDEFWKYEMSKNRRGSNANNSTIGSLLDSQTNEDLWHRQLGKHADEFQVKKGENTPLP